MSKNRTTMTFALDNITAERFQEYTQDNRMNKSKLVSFLIQLWLDKEFDVVMRHKHVK